MKKRQFLVIGAAAVALYALMKKGIKFTLEGIVPNPNGSNNVIKYNYQGKFKGLDVEGDFWMPLYPNNQPYTSYTDAVIDRYMHPKLGEIEFFVTSVNNEKGESILLFDIVQKSNNKLLYQRKFNINQDLLKLSE